MYLIITTVFVSVGRQCGGLVFVGLRGRVARRERTPSCDYRIIVWNYKNKYNKQNYFIKKKLSLNNVKYTLMPIKI